MTSKHTEIDALVSILQKRPEFLASLNPSSDFNEIVKILNEVAVSNNISIDAGELEKIVAQIQASAADVYLTDDKLVEVAAGGEMHVLTDTEKTGLAIFYGTGIGALQITLQAEAIKPGGAKEIADAIYNGGKTNLWDVL